MFHRPRQRSQVNHGPSPVEPLDHLYQVIRTVPPFQKTNQVRGHVENLQSLPADKSSLLTVPTSPELVHPPRSKDLGKFPIVRRRAGEDRHASAPVVDRRRATAQGDSPRGHVPGAGVVVVRRRLGQPEYGFLEHLSLDIVRRPRSCKR